MRLKWVFAASLAVVLAPPGASTAHAQLMGQQPWSPPSGTQGFYAQAQVARRTGGSPQAYITQYLSSQTSIGSQTNQTTTSIGNLDQITQILSGGSTAYLDSRQGNTGNQGASTTAGTTISQVSTNQQQGAQGQQTTMSGAVTATPPGRNNKPTAPKPVN
jgi:hypothetical protein